MLQNVEKADISLESRKPFNPHCHRASSTSSSFLTQLFRSAKASGLLALLSQDEVRAYSEMDTLVDANQQVYLLGLGNARMEAILMRFGLPGTQKDRWEHATPEDLRDFTNVTADEAYMISATMLINQQINGAAGALLSGERDSKKIYAAELTPMQADLH